MTLVDKIAECHGSIHWAQCASPCIEEIWPMQQVKVPETDLETFHTLQKEVPKCPHCKKDVVRPNVLMFGDGTWIEDRTAAQEKRFDAFVSSLDENNTKLLIIEIGAGKAVPTIRMNSEDLYVTIVNNWFMSIPKSHFCLLFVCRDFSRARKFRKSLLVRINPTDHEVPEGHVSLPVGALEALNEINKCLK